MASDHKTLTLQDTEPLALAQVLAKQLAISPIDWHRLNSNRQVRAKEQVAAALDRNGLRPARYIITSAGLIIVSSEAGVVDVPIETIVEKGRLGPGQVIAVDFQTHEILKNWDIKQRVAKAQPYGEWLRAHRQDVSPQLFREQSQLDEKVLLTDRKSVV